MFYPTFYPNYCYGNNQFGYPAPPPLPPYCDVQHQTQMIPTTTTYSIPHQYTDQSTYFPVIDPVPYVSVPPSPPPPNVYEAPMAPSVVYPRPPVKIRMKPQSSSVTVATLYSHKIFVGSLAKDTSPQDLVKVFSRYGTVIEAKVIVDGEGVSKGFGFVSFPTPEPVEKVLVCPTIYIEGKRIVVASAVRKHKDD